MNEYEEFDFQKFIICLKIYLIVFLYFYFFILIIKFSKLILIDFNFELILIDFNFELILKLPNVLFIVVKFSLLNLF